MNLGIFQVLTPGFTAHVVLIHTRSWRFIAVDGRFIGYLLRKEEALTGTGANGIGVREIPMYYYVVGSGGTTFGSTTGGTVTGGSGGLGIIALWAGQGEATGASIMGLT